MLFNCGVGEDSWESLDCKEIKPVHPKGNQSWILWPPDVKSWLIWKDPDTGKLEAGGEGDDRGWDGWMASPTRWTWVWVSSGSWWWTGRPGVLQCIGFQRVRHNWAELNWTELMSLEYHITSSILPDFSCNCSGHVHVESTHLCRQHPLSSKGCAWPLPFFLRASSEPIGRAGQKVRMLIPVGMMLHQWRCWIYWWTLGEPFLSFSEALAGVSHSGWHLGPWSLCLCWPV